VVKEKKFYPLYIKQAEVVENAASLLFQLLKEDSLEKRKELGKEIKKNESLGDKIADTIFDELYKTFVTPFDREDVQALASKVETFLDFIHDSSKKLVIYHPQAIDKVWIEMGEAIYEDARIISGIMSDLENINDKSKYLMQKCMRIKEIENEVDDLYECYISNLFEVEKNPIELTKYISIAQTLEDATDKAKEISDCVKTIIVKVG
jgi:Phosphate transport regulator (distant homolog of PhoU)